MKRLLAALALCLGAYLSAPADVFDHPLTAATQDEFSAVCAVLSAHAIQKGDFTQTKHIAKLNRDLVSSGTYLISRDDGIVWQTKKPFPSTLTVTSAAVMQTTASGKKSVLIAGSNPTFESFSTIISSVFVGGDRLNAQHFDIYFSPSADGWTIALVPKDAAIRAVAQQFVLCGAAMLQSVTMHEPGGDFVRYEFANQSFPATLTDDEKALFAAQ
ncbi:MAG: outer membrane lipoprotein carrier protein LolA [Treponema sp.]|nr:outer membrane lipoprotein carrier protein LolA [Treponema sp.]